METKKKITAICGWAVPSAWFKETVMSSFPQCDVRAIYPNSPLDSEEAKQILLNDESDLYIGYSMGSLWLLFHKELIPQRSAKALIAPILSFVKEDKRGGKTPSAQLLYFLKTLRKNPEDSESLINFFAKCNLSSGEKLLGNIPENDILLKGLEFLRDIKVEGEQTQGFMAFLGDKDPFLDIKIREYIPQLEVVDDCDHAPNKLLDALANRLLWNNGN